MLSKNGEDSLGGIAGLKGGKKGMRCQVFLRLTLVSFQRSIENGYKVRMGSRFGGAGRHGGLRRRDTMDPSISSRRSTAHDWQKTRGLTRGNKKRHSYGGPAVASAHVRLSFSLISPHHFPDRLNSKSARSILRMRGGKVGTFESACADGDTASAGTPEAAI